MKIIRKRRVENRNLETLETLPKRKALLVGIQYENGEDSDEEGINALRGPHHDVDDVRQLLIDHYGYAPGDVVILIDRDDLGQMQPTRANILRQIQTLVDDARSGDHFFFFYAGHTEQIENENENEIEEYLFPSDGENNLIGDNELRQYLLDPLPIGSNLVAIFDCPSLLDLEHSLCNRAYVPWISKGKRRSDSRWNTNMRQQNSNTRAELTPRLSTYSTAKFLRKSRDHSLTSLTIRTKSLSFISGSNDKYDLPSSPIQRSSSPISTWPCTGWCPPMSPDEANVISLAACGNGQLTWENGDGSSMTKALVSALRNNPHPALVDLLTQVSHELHGMYLLLHDKAQEHRRKVKDVNRRRAARNLPPLRVQTEQPEIHNFQDLKMSSHRPLDLNAKWDP